KYVYYTVKNYFFILPNFLKIGEKQKISKKDIILQLISLEIAEPFQSKTERVQLFIIIISTYI
ncbi:MAG: hypothetical protein K2O52_06065, partial [Oscillospiraceae bacterium]|nr:hypothetical protein [Oscillospiraceae bacterium]